MPTPTVPNAMPVSHNAVGPPPHDLLHLLGAGVGGRSPSRDSTGPASASRTEPPTRYNSWPAAANAAPSSRSTGACLFKATAAAVSRSASWALQARSNSVVGWPAGRLCGPRRLAAGLGRQPHPVARRTSGEYVQKTGTCQLLSLGCRTANKPNHVAAGAGAAVVALPVRPKTARTTSRPVTQPTTKPRRNPFAAPRAGAAAHRARNIRRRAGHRRYRRPT